MIKHSLNYGHDHYALMTAEQIALVASSAELNKYMGVHSRMWNMSRETFMHRAVVGHEGYVQQSDAFLREIEDLVPMSRGWRNIDDVVGAVPNIPAFLSGHPQCMRRRVRTTKENAPLTIFIDLGSSAMVPESVVLKRGIILLALVRMLVNHRSVELWAGACLSDRIKSGTVAWRIDTAPMDLARAAFHIADVSMSRLFGYSVCSSIADYNLVGNWVEYEQRMQELKQVAGWGETLFIPRAHGYDPMVSDPIQWVKTVMNRYVKGEE